MAAVWTEAAHISQAQTNRSQFVNSTLQVLPTPAKGGFTAQVLAEDASQSASTAALSRCTALTPGARHSL